MTSSALPVLSGGRRLATSPPPHAYFVVSAVFHYLGPALAVLLFVRVEPLGGGRGGPCARAVRTYVG